MRHHRSSCFVLFCSVFPIFISISYGFVLPDNPYGGLDYWVKVPPNDPGVAWKQALLDGHSLTRTQAYDFSGTLRAGGEEVRGRTVSWSCFEMSRFATFLSWEVFFFSHGLFSRVYSRKMPFAHVFALNSLLNLVIFLLPFWFSLFSEFFCFLGKLSWPPFFFGSPKRTFSSP